MVKKPPSISNTLVESSNQHRSVNHAIQFGLDKIVYPFEFFGISFESKKSKFCNIEWAALTAFLKEGLILVVVAVEIVRKAIESVYVIPSLEENAGFYESGNPTIPIAERV